jgi:hypothetical protein
MAVRTQKRRVREPFPVPMPMNSGVYKKIAYSFVGVTILIVFVALWFSSVKATVTVSAKREPTSVSVDVDVAKSPNANELPGRVVQGVFEASDSFKASSGAGEAVLGVSKGRVRITNELAKSQPLVKTTRLLTEDGRLYRISDSVDVPAGGSVEVDAYADAEGGTYDFTGTTVFTIPGLSTSVQKVVTAQSVSPFTGGLQTIHAVSQEDITKAEDAMKAKALETAKAALGKETADPRFTDATYVVNSVSENAGAKVGDQVDDFLLSEKVSVTGVFYARADVDAFVRDRVKDRVPTGREIAIVGDEDVKVTYAVASSDASTERARLTATANVQTKPTTADNLVSKEAIAGLSVDEAISKIQNMPGIDSVDITIRPSWVKRLPTLKDHIVIKVR